MGGRLDSVDNAWLRMESPDNLMMITGLLELDGRLEVEVLRALAAARLLPFDRFAQRVVEREGASYWEDVASPDLGYHVAPTAPARLSDEPAVRQWAGRLVSKGLDPRHPLWQIDVAYRGERTLLCCRLHHCIADGFALMHVMLSLTDAEARPPRPSAPPPRLHPDPADHHRLAPAQLARQLRRAGAAALHLLPMRGDPDTCLRGPLGVAKRVAWSTALDLEEVKRAGRLVDATVNDVLLAAAAGALRRYLIERGEDPRGLEIRAVVPVNLRGADEMEALGNHFGLVFLELPIGVEDPVGRLRALKLRMDALKRSIEAVVLFRLLALAGRVHERIEALLLQNFQSKATVVMTNVPGPRAHRFLGGLRIESIMFWVPQAARLGVGLSIFSYAGEVRVGIAADAERVPEPALLVSHFERELEALLAAT